MTTSKDVTERALWTFVQTFLGIVAAAQFANLHSLHDYLAMLGASAFAALISVAKSFGVSASTVAQVKVKVDQAASLAEKVAPAKLVPVVKDVVAVADTVATDAEAVLASAPGAAVAAPAVAPSSVPRPEDVMKALQREVTGPNAV